MQRNYIAFGIVTISLLATWFWLQQAFPPVAKNDPKKDQLVEEKKAPKLTPAQQEAMTLVLTHADLASAAIQPALPWLMMPSLNRISAYIPRPRVDQLLDWGKQAKIAQFPMNFADVASLLAQVLPHKSVPTTEIIGGAGYHLEVELTSLGAGIRRVTLNRFKAADYLGRPTTNNLDLVPDDPYQPSYLMSHYPNAKAQEPILGLGELVWSIDSSGKGEDGVQEVVYSTRVPDQRHLKITKTYRLAKTDYHVTMMLRIKDDRDPAILAEATPFRYQFAGAHGLPIEGEWYTSAFRNAITLRNSGGTLTRDLEDSGRVGIREGGDKVPLGIRGDDFLQFAGVATQYFAALIVVDDQQPSEKEGGVKKEGILAWARPTLEAAEHKGRIRSIQGDRLIFEEPEGKDRIIREYRLLKHVQERIKDEEIKEGNDAVLTYYRASNNEYVASAIRPHATVRPQFGDITNRVNSEPIDFKPGMEVAHQFLLYHGPVKVRLLGTFRGEAAVPSETVTRYADTLHLRTMTDYPSNSFSRMIYFSDIVVFFTNLMHRLLDWLHFIVAFLPDNISYGISIVMLTVIVRGAMFPISRRSALFSIRMQALQPELKKIAEKYADDATAKGQATMELYRKHKIHPLGSCLPMFLQLPIFMGLYFTLQESIHFRLAPFLWITNLAAPDMLVWWGEQIPWLSDPSNQGAMMYLGPYLNILPVCAATLMIVQQSIMTPPPTDEQQAMQQKTMKFMMIFMGLMFYKVAAGLCIYFISSSLWGLAERQLLPKKKPLATGGVDQSISVNGAKPYERSPRAQKVRNKSPIKDEPDGMVARLKNWWEDVLDQARKK